MSFFWSMWISMGLSSVGFGAESAKALEELNLLGNASFEEMVDGHPSGWAHTTWSGAPSFSVESSFARTGRYCVMVESAEGADASWSQHVEVRPRTRYRLSAWIKTEDLDKGLGHGVQLNLHELQFVGKTESITDPNSDWVQVSSEFDSGPHERLMVNLLLGGWGRSRGKAWFDDVSLVDLTPPPPTMTEAEAVQFFEESVYPLLESGCFECHGPDSPVRGRLFLGNREGLLQGGESGPVIDIENPLDSLFLSAIHYETYQMPPSGKLPASAIETLTQWVRLGAPFPEAFEKPSPKREEESHAPRVDEISKSHWSFQELRRPKVPHVASSWVRNPIDAFVARKLGEEGLTPAQEASRAHLARRVSYDIIGLPPTAEEVRAFVSDTRPDAYERMVDRLLESPHYGEKWARHWLDLVRYAETNSFERDGDKPHVWRFRDWVIRSFNDDKPFDRFLLEQLAGDELEDVSNDSIIATGYYRIGQWDDEPADPKQAMYDELDDILTTTSQAFMGLTINCARCHDHKLDPISQRDYYSMLAFFRNIRRYGKRSHDSVRAASVRDISSDEAKRDRQEEIEAHQNRVLVVEDALVSLEAPILEVLDPVEHEEFVHEQNRLALVRKRQGALISESAVQRYADLLEERKTLRRFRPQALAEALAVKEHGTKAPPTHVLIRGNPHVESDRVEPRFPEILGGRRPSIAPSPHGDSSGRRLALARWLVDPSHPLTSRVLANRLWLWHFDQGLVRTPNDFGLQGLPPTHPELLDWLASEIVAQGWSLKAMHRLILTSSTYRQSTIGHPDGVRLDPENKLLSRFRMRRLTAEEVRDSVLAVSAELNLETMGGPSMYPLIPQEVLAGQSRPGHGWGKSSPEDRARRSIYIFIKRSLIVPILANFDVADTDFTCPVRFTTTQPTQALGMINSEWIHKRALAFAKDIQRTQPGNREAQVRAVLRRTLQREPNRQEIARGLDYLKEVVREDGLDEEAALQTFCVVAMNLNEFLYLN